MMPDTLAPCIARSSTAMLSTMSGSVGGPCFPSGKSSTTCAIPVWRNVIKCKYKFISTQLYPAYKELTLEVQLIYKTYLMCSSSHMIKQNVFESIKCQKNFEKNNHFIFQSHHSACWWPGTWWCQAINRHSDDHFWASYIREQHLKGPLLSQK